MLSCGALPPAAVVHRQDSLPSRGHLLLLLHVINQVRSNNLLPPVPMHPCKYLCRQHQQPLLFNLQTPKSAPKLTHVAVLFCKNAANKNIKRKTGFMISLLIKFYMVNFTKVVSASEKREENVKGEVELHSIRDCRLGAKKTRFLK